MKFGLYWFIVSFTIYFSLLNSDLPPNYIRHVIYHEYFRRDVTTAQAARSINNVYGQGSTSEQTFQTWFKRFRSGEISLEDQPRSGRPLELEDHSLIDLLKEDNRQTIRDLADQLGPLILQ